MKKYLPYIIGYSIYASIVLIAIAGERGHHFWEPFIGWLVTIPLILGCVVYLIWRYYHRSGTIDYNVADTDDVSTDNVEVIEQSSLFVQSWSLLDFARKCGPKMQVRSYINSLTGKPFKLCIFIDNSSKETSVRFLSQLGELTPSEISARKENLKIGKMSNNKLYLYDKDINEWETVDLGL